MSVIKTSSSFVGIIIIALSLSDDKMEKIMLNNILTVASVVSVSDGFVE